MANIIVNKGRHKINGKMLVRFRLQLYRQVFVLMGILFLFIFSYIPMVGIIIAFKNYKLASGLLGFLRVSGLVLDISPSFYRLEFYDYCKEYVYDKYSKTDLYISDAHYFCHYNK